MVNELVESLFYLITQRKLMKNRFSIFRIVACFWLSIVFISTGFAHTPNQQDSIDKAPLWLEQQQVNGVFETPQSSSIHWQVSQEALEAFVITEDRKSTRLNSSHVRISYAVFCLKKKKKKKKKTNNKKQIEQKKDKKDYNRITTKVM